MLEENIKCCDRCGAKEGHKRPVGRYLVELHTLDVLGKKLELCITCYKFKRRELRKIAAKDEIEKVGFISNLRKAYKEAFHHSSQEY
ncbi:MAG: hypothetical protein RLN81_04340 [Balneolaceae bacterium]